MGADIRIRNCLTELPKLADASIDGIITDPPFEIGYQKANWDRTGVTWQPRLWSELFRVLRPGGYLLVIAGPQNYHRMAALAEKAGFRILPHLKWTHDAPSLPKTRKLSTLIDARLGVARTVVGSAQGPWFPNETSGRRGSKRDQFGVYSSTSSAPP